jgi:hypothetical protein
MATSPSANSQTPSSSLSISPQTPFFPPPSLANTIGSPTSNPTLATSPTNKNFIRYAAALSKSPPTTTPMGITTQRGFQPIQPLDHDHDHDHPEHHDSFEFGDYGDLKSKSWTAGVNRRAASISGPVPTTQGQAGQGLGIMGGLSASRAEGGSLSGQGQQGGVMADKVAKGQGVLRRLSLSGGSFSRVSGAMNRFEYIYTVLSFIIAEIPPARPSYILESVLICAVAIIPLSHIRFRRSPHITLTPSHHARCRAASTVSAKSIYPPASS